MNKRIGIIFAVICGMSFSSCDSFFDIQTENFQAEENTYKDRSTVYGGMIGLCANFRSLGEHHIILTELLGDLMEPTRNASDEYWDIFRYKAKNIGSGSFASPAPYYQLIVNCNDYLRHVVRYKKEYPDGITNNIYNGLVAAAVTYRTWAYLQIGKLYGEAVYFDLAHADVENVLPERILSLDELLPELISHLKTGVDGINAFQTLDWRMIISPEVASKDFDAIWNRVAVDPNMLLCELYLWSGDYINAAKTGINYVSGSGEDFKMDVFKNDSKSKWYELFTKKLSKDHAKEALTVMPFDFNMQQTHKLHHYFSNSYPSVYLFKPTIQAMSRFLDQIERVDKDEITGEFIFTRGIDRRVVVTFDGYNGDYCIRKYSQLKASHEQDAPIYIYRSAELYLMIAEALNGIGNNRAADSLMNSGLATSWSSTFFKEPFDTPIYTSALSKVMGIRSRAGIHGDYVRYHLDTLLYATESARKERSQFIMDSLITEETALELAYEGKRWFNLLRIARNTNKPQHLAIPVSKKFGDEAKVYETWLMDPKNWFIKWDHRMVQKELKSVTEN